MNVNEEYLKLTLKLKRNNQSIINMARQLWTEHKTTIGQDNDAYQHLHIDFGKHGDAPWVDIVTWPNYLTIVGNITKGYTFKHDRHMLQNFFKALDVNMLPLEAWAKASVDEPRKLLEFRQEEWLLSVMANLGLLIGSQNIITRTLKQDHPDFDLKRTYTAEDVFIQAKNHIHDYQSAIAFDKEVLTGDICAYGQNPYALGQISNDFHLSCILLYFAAQEWRANHK